MKKEFNQMVKAIEVTKRYSPKEVQKLAKLFLYLNDIEGLMDEYKYGVSAKWLRKLLNPLTRNNKPQKFDDWRKSVSNISRLKENEDFVKTEVISKVESKVSDLSENSETSNNGRGWARSHYGTKEIDYIITLRAGEYCATLTKGDAGDLYRRFIFDIKDEFIRLVFRRWKSVDTRIEFTNAIAKLSFVMALPKEEQRKIYAHFTNVVYLNLQDIEMEAKEYKKRHGISKKEIAKHYFKKDGLLDLEKIENKLATIIDYIKPQSADGLSELFSNFFESLSE